MAGQLTPAWFPLRYHPQQFGAYHCPKRFIIVPAGRGSGKSEVLSRRVVRQLGVKRRWLDPKYFFALPTREQAKRIRWEKLKALVPAAWLKCAPSETDLIIKTTFGSELHLVGMDKPQRIEGLQWDGGVFDESCDQRPEAFSRSVLPALSERSGWCARIGVPKRFGVGAVAFRQACERGLGDDPNSATYHWPSADIISAEELAIAASQVSPEDFEEQYGAQWLSVGGAIFYCFDKALNVNSDIKYNPTRTICVSSDFNVDPMAWVVGHRSVNGIDIFDEIYLRNCNTQAAMDELYRRYGRHITGWEFFGDASGAARKTVGSSAAQSDLLVIMNDARFKNRTINYSLSNPPRVDRFAACNAMLCNAMMQRRLMINPRCTNLIADLAARGYKQGTREPNDTGDVGHITDALGYLIYSTFPIRYDTKPSTAGVFTT